jgi:DNA-binding transcriptional regulator PaaX
VGERGAAAWRGVEALVRTAWPGFDWEAAYQTFLDQYTPLCTVEQLAGTRALEMAARCVVETGTAAFYRMVSELSGDRC